MGRVKTPRGRRLPILVALVTLLTLITVTNPRPAEAAISRDAYEDCLLDRANEARSDAGVGQLQMAHELVPQVRAWSEWMRFNGFGHMSPSQQMQILPDSTTALGENIAMHSYSEMPDCDLIHELWMDSTGHRRNILNTDYRFVAIGTYVDGSGWWATQLFFDASGYNADCNGAFCDDDGSAFEASIELIAAAGITNGCNPPAGNRYCPDDPVTRGQMAAFLARALDLPTSDTTDFIDDNDSTFEDPIQRLAGAGITRGCNPPANDRFCPGDPVTRGQMAAFLARALDL